MSIDQRLTVSQISKMVSVAKPTIILHIQQGKLKAVKRLNKYVVEPDDLESWAKAQGLMIDYSKK